MQFLLDQSYPVPGGRLSFDLFRPEGEQEVPLVVFMHGGGWISGDKTMYRDEALWLAPQGFACACIEYRLAPLYPFPAAVADAQSFVRWARSESASLGIDPGRIVAVGNSAGGHLACMLGLADVDMDGGGPGHKADAVVGVCPITDLRDPRAQHFPVAMAFLEQFMGGPYEADPDAWALASPLTHVSPNDRPFLLLHGTADDIVPTDQSRALVRAMHDAGIASRLVELEGEAHSFTMDGWDRVRAEYVSFLQALAPL
jgi:acetyl esterase/lipase